MRLIMQGYNSDNESVEIHAYNDTADNYRLTVRNMLGSVVFSKTMHSKEEADKAFAFWTIKIKK